MFVGTNGRIRGGTCCEKIKKRARKPCPIEVASFRGGENGIRILFFFVFFPLWKMDGFGLDLEILKDVDGGLDGRWKMYNRRVHGYKILEAFRISLYCIEEIE